MNYLKKRSDDVFYTSEIKQICTLFPSSVSSWIKSECLLHAPSQTRCGSAKDAHAEKERERETYEWRIIINADMVLFVHLIPMRQQFGMLENRMRLCELICAHKIATTYVRVLKALIWIIFAQIHSFSNSVNGTERRMIWCCRCHTYSTIITNKFSNYCGGIQARIFSEVCAWNSCLLITFFFASFYIIQWNLWIM